MKFRLAAVFCLVVISLLMPTKVLAASYYFNTSVETGSNLQMRKTLENGSTGSFSTSSIALGQVLVGTWQTGPLGLTEIPAGTYSFGVWADRPTLVSAGNISARVYAGDTGTLIGTSNTAAISTTTSKVNFSLTTASATPIDPDEGVIIRLYLNVISVSVFLDQFNVYWGTSTYDSEVSMPFSGDVYFGQSSAVDLGDVTKTLSLQSVSNSLGDIMVVNGTEALSGWNLTMTVSDFSCCGGAHTLDVSNNWVNPDNASFTTWWGSPTGVANGLLHNFISTSDQTSIMTANSGGGYGVYSVNPVLEIRIPAEAYAGTYSGTVTLTLL